MKRNESTQVQTKLLLKREEVEKLLLDRISKGNQLIENQISNKAEFDRERAEYSKWSKYNTDLLRKVSNNSMLADEYSRSSGIAFLGNTTMQEDIREHRENIQKKIDRLDSIIERLELYDEPHEFYEPQTLKVNSISNDKIFIVHGRNETVKIDVARTLEKLQLNPIILHEKPNAGLTIIEKLETHSDVGFAVVILTDDDEGKSKSESGYKLRARQNVIAELGYFVGKLGRKKVCSLYVEDVEIPSDFNGVLYVPLDPSGSWKFQLVKELKSAGYNVDANKLLD